MKQQERYAMKNNAKKRGGLMKPNTRRLIVIFGVCLVLMMLICGSWAQAETHWAIIAPIDTMPEGQTYGRWAAEWQQWAQGTPAATNPILDKTGEYCSQRQVGDVWFLGGSVYNAGLVERDCEIPAGKSLFFPLINGGYAAFRNDPPETRTEEFVRAAAACTVPAKISVWIDDFKVPEPRHFFTGKSGSLSPLFNIQLPPGNLFSDDTNVIPELLLSPAAEQGYYLFVKPLRPGKHTIRWVATGCQPGATQDIIWHLTVVH